MPKRCDIIMPVWNQLEATRECLNSIVKHTDYPYRLIIIDNACDSPTANYLKNLKCEKYLDLFLVRNEKNLGFVKAVNQGIAVSDAPYLCIMNNDTIATAGWLDEMVAVIEAHPEIGLLNPSSNTSGQLPGDMSVDEYAASLLNFKGQAQELNTCRGFCMLMRNEVVRRVGSFDERFGFGYFEETDFCKRAQECGFMLGRAKASYVYHKEGTSFKDLEDSGAIFKKNEAVYFNKWGRLVRTAYIIDAASSVENVNDIAINIARNGHQILFYIKNGIKWPVGIDHFDIRRFSMAPAMLGVASLYKLIKCRRKKPVEVVLTDSAALGNLLTVLKGLHGADVMIHPRKEEVLALLAKKSREF